jgi:hypothetical protein
MFHECSIVAPINTNDCCKVHNDDDHPEKSDVIAHTQKAMATEWGAFEDILNWKAFRAVNGKSFFNYFGIPFFHSEAAKRQENFSFLEIDINARPNSLSLYSPLSTAKLNSWKWQKCPISKAQEYSRRKKESKGMKRNRNVIHPR